MNAQDVYNIAKALPQEELIHLYTMISKSFNEGNNKKIIKQPVLTDMEAQQYLLNSIFSEQCINQRLKKDQS